MKLKALALVLFAAGIGSSFALADPGHGKGNGKNAAPNAAATTTGTTTDSGAGKGNAKGKTKVTLCHKAGKKWVKVTVAAPALKQRLKKGDVAPDASGKCPAGASKPAETTPTTTTSVTTTDAATTTSVTTTTVGTTTTAP
jgi:hypothetical protein